MMMSSYEMAKGTWLAENHIGHISPTLWSGWRWVSCMLNYEGLNTRVRTVFRSPVAAIIVLSMAGMRMAKTVIPPE